MNEERQLTLFDGGVLKTAVDRQDDKERRKAVADKIRQCMTILGSERVAA